MTLFRELFNKTGQTYRITLAEPVDPNAALAELDGNLSNLTEGLRRFVAEEMPGGARRFDPNAMLTPGRTEKPLPATRHHSS
jgi:hypothetical protein